MTRYVCSVCRRRYNSDGTPPLAGPPLCSGGGKHKRRAMVEQDEYQAALDDMGIADDDPLREAT